MQGMEQALDALLGWKALIVATWLAAFFISERIWPSASMPQEVAAQDHGPVRRIARNAGLWLINVAISPLIVLPVSLWAAQHGLGWREAAAFTWWSGWTGLAIDLLLLDFLIYWWHRANHEFGLLWRFHQVHHLDRFLDTTSAVRFHFGEVLLSALARAVVIVAFDIPFTSVLVFEIAVLVAAIFHHSNVRLPRSIERGLALVMITPSLHWVHHHAVDADLRSNYGTALSVWDRLFATRSRTRRSADMPIGIPNARELGLVGLLLRPFALSDRNRKVL